MEHDYEGDCRSCVENPKGTTALFRVLLKNTDYDVLAGELNRRNQGEV